MTPWEAPTAPGPLVRTVRLPGSKSIAARALVLAALADGASVLHGVPDARDSRIMRAGLEAFGTVFTDDEGEEGLRVTPGTLTGGGTVDCGLAGTAMRFLPPLAALATGTTQFTGDPQASSRPVGPLLAALAELGAQVSEPYALPFSVGAAPRPNGGPVHVDASGSSQFLSGLLLSGCLFDRGLAIEHTGETLPSLPHIQMTVAMLRDRGVEVGADDDARRWAVRPGAIAAREEWIEPDLTNTATFLAAALVTGGRVRALWPAGSVQPAGPLLGVLEAFGACLSFHMVDGRRMVLADGADGVQPADVDLGAVSEFTPVAAALAALAPGPSRLRGVGHIRGHETDRLAALAAELTALGARVDERPDGLRIVPKPLRARQPFRTYGDHRMAHAAALLGLAVPGLSVDDISVTTKTLADFPRLWHDLVQGSR